ncbi:MULTISPECIES: cell wall metabolism sensor histidine kinase WalK [Amycolatopsis]|uniref:histidine kinase n=1 Tax=Amycolatopsis tucumanensis TaxID=401106 RepID=A0ABP7HYL2_9PSEU|nr:MULTISPECIES: HAMP domain-containing sensor histidine kinase [Amycolatopsis]MCF6422361.1 HAMP domain-containing histidine kinase [Amycolatopsis tucumanensis]
MRPHFGLRARIAAAVVVVTVAATAAMALAAYQLQSNDTTRRFHSASRADFASDLAQVRFVAQNLSTDRVIDYMSREHAVAWSVFDYTGEQAVLHGAEPPVAVPGWLLSAARAGDEPLGTEPENSPFLVLAGSPVKHVVLVEYYTLDALRADLSKLRRNLAGMALLVTVLGIAGGMVAAKRIQRPVRAVANAAIRLGGGELDTRLVVRGGDELADLAGSFNAMAEQVGRSIAELRAKEEQQRRFVADVAHDLRTPVATVVAAADGVDSENPDARRRAARLLSVQSRRLANLVEDLLEMSRFDAGVADFHAGPLDLADLWAEAIDLVGGADGTTLHTVGDVTVCADPRRVHTIARNLLTNALTHGAAPITVTIDGTRPGVVTAEVADSGPGVPEDLRELVFDRFARGDRARTATSGSGLGLAIAQENARIHGGRITVSEQDGAVFTVVLPRGQ